MDEGKKLQQDSWKIFRILSEFVDGFESMTKMGPSVSIFGSARVQPKTAYYQMAIELAEKIAEKGFGIITGGGPGIMEAANRGAQKANGRSCGLSVTLPFEEDSNPYIDPKYNLTFRYFFIRKVMFVRYAQAFIFLPGGFGTLDELFEALTLIQTEKIKPFPLILIGTEYWKGLLDWIQSVLLERHYLKKEDLDLVSVTDDIDEVVARIVKHYEQVGKEPTYELGQS